MTVSREREEETDKSDGRKVGRKGKSHFRGCRKSRWAGLGVA